MDDKKICYCMEKDLFTLVEFELAMATINSALITGFQEDTEHRLETARNAYDIVREVLGEVDLLQSEQEEVEEKLATLQARMDAVGQKISNESLWHSK